MSHSAEKFPRGILHCCNKFGDRKSLDKRGGGVSRFSVENCLSHSAENSLGESFTVAIISVIEKVASRFSVENFLPHSVENFRRGILYCCNIFGYRKSLDKRRRGVSRFSVENFFSHSAENLSRGESFSVSLNSGIGKLYASEGYVTIFCRFFLSHSAKNFAW